MGGKYHWVLLGLLAATLLLGALRPDARERLRATLLLVVISALAMFVAAALPYRGMLDDQSLGYRLIHYGSQLFLAIACTNLVGVLVFRVLLPPVRLQPAPILRDTILGIAYLLAAILLLARHGVNLSGVVATSAVVTAVIAFSLQDTLGNVMSGMSLQAERSIAVGDWIRMGEVEGVVREIRWRQTSIETRNWDTVVIPNSVLMKSQVTVLGRREGQPRLHREWVYFNVDFRHAPSAVIDTVQVALRDEPIPSVAVQPPPECILRDFKESYGMYAVRYWTADLGRMDPTSSEVRTRIYVALQRQGISLSIPAQSVFMTLEGRSRTERKRKAEQERRIAALKGVHLFQPLTGEELMTLAARLSVTPFRRGEVVTRQGAAADHLFLIERGDVEVTIEGADGHGPGHGHARRVATLRGGDVFGEMGLMTGERRTATVTALTDVSCYRLDKAAFEATLKSRPEIAEAISTLLAKRKLELEAATAGLSEEAVQRKMLDVRGEMLRRVRGFFLLD